jgi:DNA-binding IclR family transcriptional regulator
MDRRALAILEVVNRHGHRGVSAEDIGHNFGVTAAMIQQLVPPLLQLGLVHEMPRQGWVRVTAAGRSLVEQRY